MPNINWNANDYKNGFSFVPEYGESVINLITKDKGSRVIDLGCGNGMLTDKLAEKGYDVTGIDDSVDMLELARKEYPDYTFVKGNAVEKAGFRVEYAVLFDRPTKQVGDNGLANWINMFVKKPFEGVNEDIKQEIIEETVEKLRAKLYIEDCWIVDYVRIRFRAVK